MTQEELQKLKENLNKRLSAIDKELRNIAYENPMIQGDFEVKIDDLGPSLEDNEQEAGELDRNQALVNVLEKERKDIQNTLQKIEAGAYGKCEDCSSNINPARLKVMPIAAFCIDCANKVR